MVGRIPGQESAIIRAFLRGFVRE